MINALTDRLTSLQVERHFLSSLVKFPELLYEVDSFLKNEDFANNLHGIIFSVARQEILSGNTFDKVILAQKIKSLNITTKDDVDIFSYVENLYLNQINQKGGINAAKELVKLRIRRDIYKDSQEVQNFIVSPKCSEQTVAEIVSEVDSIYNKRINAITVDDEPTDLFAGIEQYIKDIATNPVEECGLTTPFKQYNKFFGGLKAGDGAYLYSARSSEGKSVWLFNLAKGISIINNCKILYLDTEMSLKLNMIRASAAQAGINPWFLQTGKWIYNETLKDKVMSSFPEFNKYNGLFFHKYVPNKNSKEIISIARKWFHKYVGRGNKAFIIWDYLKVVGSGDNDRNEWQRFGDNVSYFNELGASLDIQMAIAAQQNRIGNQGGVRLDDDTTIGGSDRINQFSRFGAIFRRKTLDEISEQGGTQFGTHLLKPIKWSRDQGELDYNQHCYIKVTENGRSKFKQNYINYTINHYDIKESGTLKDIIDHQNLTKSLAETNPNNDNEIDL